MTPFEAARAAFEEYARLNHGELPPDEQSALQVRLARWQDDQFGSIEQRRKHVVDPGDVLWPVAWCESVTVTLPLEHVVSERSMELALGIVEEVGEFYDASLIGKEDALFDAVGDVLVFANQLCTLQRLDFGTLWAMRRISAPASAEVVASWLGKLAHVSLKSAQGIRGYADKTYRQQRFCDVIVEFLGVLSGLSVDHGVLPMVALRTVAEQVMQRNWRKNTKDGGA